MERMKIAAIFADQDTLSGREVTVCGWAKTIRDMKTFGFIELNDGSCFKNLQVVMSAEELANYKEIAAQNVGAALIVRGTVVLTPDAKQPLEVKAHSIEVEGKSTPDYPLQKKRHSVEFLRTIQHLRPRTNLFSATFRVRSVAAYAVHEFSQLTGALDADQLHALKTVLDAMMGRMEEYTSFSGAPEGAVSSMKFLYKTAENVEPAASVVQQAAPAEADNFFVRLWKKFIALFQF